VRLFSEFPSDPLLNLLCLSVASVVVLVGVRGIGGPAGLVVAMLGAIPLMLIFAGLRPRKPITVRR
jgi:hypothetical protein